MSDETKNAAIERVESIPVAVKLFRRDVELLDRLLLVLNSVLEQPMTRSAFIRECLGEGMLPVADKVRAKLIRRGADPNLRSVLDMGVAMVRQDLIGRDDDSPLDEE